MVAGSHSAEMSEDQSEILDVNQSAGTQSESSKQTFSIADVQELIQHVQWLQLQLKQVLFTLNMELNDFRKIICLHVKKNSF